MNLPVERIAQQIHFAFAALQLSPLKMTKQFVQISGFPLQLFTQLASPRTANWKLAWGV